MHVLNRTSGCHPLVSKREEWLLEMWRSFRKSELGKYPKDTFLHISGGVDTSLPPTLSILADRQTDHSQYFQRCTEIHCKNLRMKTFQVKMSNGRFRVILDEMLQLTKIEQNKTIKPSRNCGLHGREIQPAYTISLASTLCTRCWNDAHCSNLTFAVSDAFISTLLFIHISHK